ncbi:MAG TPA: GNAT family N-acetyltransferase [Candidatus Babeliales bacterium]|nr:GNAT family N-acetyltransferase [Candidatus Babeliales bacterium]
MKAIHIIKTLFLSALILGPVNLHSAGTIQAEYAKVLFTSPDNPNIKVCARYYIKNSGRYHEHGFKITLYEAHAHNLKNNKPVGYIHCTTNENTHRAHIEAIYVNPKERRNRYFYLLLQLALQECTNRGFEKVTLTPMGFETIPTETLEQIYSMTGAKPSSKLGDMEYDTSLLEKQKPKSFDVKILNDLMYYKNLLAAAWKNDLKKLISVLHEGVNPNSHDLDPLSEDTALMLAARAGHLNIIKHLISQAGADVNITTGMHKSKYSLLTAMIGNKHFTKHDIAEILRISNFTPEIKEEAIEYARRDYINRPDIAELIENYDKPKAKL